MVGSAPSRQLVYFNNRTPRSHSVSSLFQYLSIKWPITWGTNPSHFAHVALRPIRSSFFSRTSTSSKDSSQVQRSGRRELGSQLVTARRSFKISNISHCVDGFKISNQNFGCSSFRAFFSALLQCQMFVPNLEMPGVDNQLLHTQRLSRSQPPTGWVSQKIWHPESHG